MVSFQPPSQEVLSISLSSRRDVIVSLVPRFWIDSPAQSYYNHRHSTFTIFYQTGTSKLRV
jgi:hypothetical protein